MFHRPATLESLFYKRLSTPEQFTHIQQAILCDSSRPELQGQDMAARCNSLPLLRAMFLITLVLATAVTPLSASTFRAFEGPGCTGKSKLISGCGCFSLENYSGGYHFFYAGGQRAELALSSTCVTFERRPVLSGNTRSCGSHRYRGVWLAC